jgi:hypothetical protein
VPYRPCLDCGAVSTRTRCPACASLRSRARDARRGTSTERGYDGDHRRLRRQWAPLVDAGLVDCARCGRPISPGTPWDLGHDVDRSVHSGPEHAGGNRARRPGTCQ